MFLTRFTALSVTLVSAVVSGYYLPAIWAIPLFAISVFLTTIGLYDLAQPLHSVRRNYPIIGRLRWFFEEIRPEIRQYLIEGDHDETPFSRSQRSLVYARAKNESSERAFGTPLAKTSILNPFGALSCGVGSLSAAIGNGGGLTPRNLLAASDVGWFGVAGGGVGADCWAAAGAMASADVSIAASRKIVRCERGLSMWSSLTRKLFRSSVGQIAVAAQWVSG